MKKALLIFSGTALLTFGSFFNTVSAQAAEVGVETTKTAAAFVNNNTNLINPLGYQVAPNYVYYETQFHTSTGLTPTKYLEINQYGYRYRGYLTYQYTYPFINFYNYAGKLYRSDYNGGRIPIPSKIHVPEEIN